MVRSWQQRIRVYYACPEPGTSATVKSSTPVYAIAGGLNGGLALAFFIILGFLFVHRRHERATQEKVLISTPEPFGTSYSPAPQTTQVGIPVTKGHVYLPPTNLQLVLSTSMANPSNFPPSVPSSPLSRGAEQRRGNPLLALSPVQNDDSWLPSAVPHANRHPNAFQCCRSECRMYFL